MLSVWISKVEVPAKVALNSGAGLLNYGSQYQNLDSHPEIACYFRDGPIF